MIGFAVIGVGGMGRTHLSSLARHEQAEVVAVHDSDARRIAGSLAPGGVNLETGAKPWDESSVRRCAKLEEVLGDAAVEAVVVATPSHVHAELTRTALGAGKHVFCEKPMALTVGECESMLSAAAAADRRLMIGHVLRFWGEYVAAAEVVRSGRLGELRGLWLSRLCGVPDFGAEGWFLDHARSGGALMDLHVHDVDYALSLLGKPRAIRARGQVGPSGGYDRVFAWYDYGAEGPAAQMEGVWTAGRDAPFVMAFRMYFEAGTIDYRSDRQPALVSFGPDGPLEMDVSAESGYAVEMDHFIGCIARGADSDVAPPPSSRDAVALAVATAESARTGKEVRIA